MVSPSSSIYPSSPRSRLQSAFRGAFCASRTQVHLSCRRNTPLVLSSSRSSDNKSESKQNNTHMKAVASLLVALQYTSRSKLTDGQRTELGARAQLDNRHPTTAPFVTSTAPPAFVTSIRHQHAFASSGDEFCRAVFPRACGCRRRRRRQFAVHGCNCYGIRQLHNNRRCSSCKLVYRCTMSLAITAARGCVRPRRTKGAALHGKAFGAGTPGRYFADNSKCTVSIFKSTNNPNKQQEH